MLSDQGIQYARTQKRLDITPFEQKQMNPASYDVLLGNEFYIIRAEDIDRMRREKELIDPYIDNSFYFDRIDITSGSLVLEPGDFCLGVTKESVKLSKYLAASVSGKSSLARLGLTVHVTAGWIDPGFEGRITLELFALVPIQLTPGMPIAQLCFEEVPGGSFRPYAGRYSRAKTVELSKYDFGRKRPMG